MSLTDDVESEDSEFALCSPEEDDGGEIEEDSSKLVFAEAEECMTGEGLDVCREEVGFWLPVAGLTR